MKDSITQVPLSNKIRSIIIAAVWLGIWQVLSLIIHNDIFLPGPYTVMLALMSLIKTSTFWLAILHSLLKICLGFLLGFLVAVVLGSVSCRFQWIKELFVPLISIIKAIPVASFIILVLVWLNTKQLSIFISFIVTFPIVYIAVLEGFEQMDKELIEMTKLFGVKRHLRIRYVYVSEILPFIITSIKVAVGMCWKAGVSAEIIGLPKNSIGEQLYLSKIYLNIDELFAWTLVIVVVCYIFERCLFYFMKILERKIIL